MTLNLHVFFFRRTPIILCSFMEPPEWGASLAMTLIEHGVRVAHRDRHGRNSLHYACIYERDKLVLVLLRAMDFDLTQSDKAGNTALHYAVMSGNITTTQSLVNAYRKYKLNFNKTNAHGRTALEEAYFCGHGACARTVENVVSDTQDSSVKDVRFSNDVTISPIHVSSRPGGRNHDVSNRPRTTPNSLPRPMSSPAVRPMTAALLTSRRDSSSSLASGDDRRNYFRSRSSLNLSLQGYYK